MECHSECDSICDKLLQVIAFMVLAIISASLAAIMFCISMPGIFVGGGDENPQVKVCMSEVHVTQTGL